MIRETILRHRRSLALASALAAAGALASIALITQIGGFMGNEANATASQVRLLPALGSLIAMLVLSVASQTCQARFGAAVISDLRAQLSARFLALDYARLMTYRERVTGALVVDVGRIAQMLLILPQALFNLLVAVSCLIYLAWLSLPLLAILLGFVLVSVASALSILHRTERFFERIRADENRLFQHFRAIAEAKKELTLNAARAAHFSERVLGKAIGDNEQSLRAANRWLGYTEVWNTAIIYAAILAVACAGRAYFTQDAAVVARFVIGSLFLIGPVSSLIAAIRHIVAGRSSIRYLETLGPAFIDAPVVRRFDPDKFVDWTRISLHQVEYRYPGNDEEFTFGPVDLEIRRGEMVFVVGGNGSGKSTLALLMTGMLAPDRGEVRVDGRLLGPDEIADFRQLFTAVFADYWIFEDLLDRQGRTPPQASIDTLLEKLGLHGKVTVTDGRFSTLDLSQGQKKRLALTQGYMEDSDVYLFDEWAADQDVEFRRCFYLELLPKLKAAGKTLIVISHDDRFFGVADRLVRLEYGRVVSETAPVAMPPTMSSARNTK